MTDEELAEHERFFNGENSTWQHTQCEDHGMALIAEVRRLRHQIQEARDALDEEFDTTMDVHSLEEYKAAVEKGTL